MAKNFNELDVICHVSKNSKKTLAASAEFYFPSNPEELPFREPSLSRLDCTLISKTDDKTDALNFNIPAKEINEVKLKSEIALQKLLTQASTVTAAASTENNGFESCPAFTVPLMLTAFKGKTAGEVLAADPGKKDELLRGKAWLETNLAKYPANKKQIEAIDNAVSLLELGEINDKTPVASSVSAGNVIIYKKEYKYKNKKDDKGNNLVYSVSIVCNPSRNMPFEVSVMNCYAPVVTSASGQTVVKTAEAVDTRRATISLTDSEWVGMITQAFDLYQNFKRLTAATAFKRVKDNSYKPEKPEE